MKKQELMNVLEKYGYPANPTEMDTLFGMNNYDAYSWSKAYRDDEAYLYDRSEWIEFLEELKQDAEENEDLETVESLEEEIKEFNDFHKNVKFVLEGKNETVFF